MRRQPRQPRLHAGPLRRGRRDATSRPTTVFETAERGRADGERPARPGQRALHADASSRGRSSATRGRIAILPADQGQVRGVERAPGHRDGAQGTRRLRGRPSTRGARAWRSPKPAAICAGTAKAWTGIGELYRLQGDLARALEHQTEGPRDLGTAEERRRGGHGALRHRPAPRPRSATTRARSSRTRRRSTSICPSPTTRRRRRPGRRATSAAWAARISRRASRTWRCPSTSGASRSARRPRTRSGVMWTLVHIGVLHASQRRFDEAGKAYERALGIAEAKPDQNAVSTVLALRSQLEFEQEKLDAALASAARAAEIAAPIEHFDTVAYARLVAGRAHQKAGRAAEARAAYEDAVAAFAKVPPGPAAETFFDNRRAPYLALVDLLASQGSLAEAFQWSERGRQQALADLLGGDGAVGGERPHRRGAGSRARGREGPADARRQDPARARRGRSPTPPGWRRCRRNRPRRRPTGTRCGGASTRRTRRFGDLRAQGEARRPGRGRRPRRHARRRSSSRSWSARRARGCSRREGRRRRPWSGAEGRSHRREGGRPRPAGPAVPRGDRAEGRRGESTSAANSTRCSSSPLDAALAKKTRLVVVPDAFLWSLPFEALPNAGRTLPGGGHRRRVRAVAHRPGGAATPRGHDAVDVGQSLGRVRPAALLGKAARGAPGARPARATPAACACRRHDPARSRTSPRCSGRRGRRTYVGDQARADRLARRAWRRARSSTSPCRSC